MRMKLMSNQLIGKIAGLAVLTITVSACSHQNPLTQNKDQKHLQEAGVFLYNAAKNAQPAINKQYALNKDKGIFYEDCMDEEVNNKDACNALYKGMISYASLQTGSSYQKLSVADVADKSMWSILSDYFDNYQQSDGYLPTY